MSSYRTTELLVCDIITTMKQEEQFRAVQLRKQGMAMGDIAKELGVAKSSVSYWVRDIRLTEGQRQRLNKNGHSVAAIEKRREARLRNTAQRRAVITERAWQVAEQLVHDPLWCVAVAMYWGEGGKTQNMVRIANSDPAVISLMMRFFREVCKVDEAKFRGHIHAFAHSDVSDLKRYWESVSGISADRFYKTYQKPSAASKGKRAGLPKGTFQIYVHDTDLFFTLMTWIDFLQQGEWGS